MPPYSAKPYLNNEDDETVDSDSEDTAAAEAIALKKKERLTTISRAYDLDGDGILDEAEQAMRDRDADGRGHLTNEEIYAIVREQLRVHKRAGMMKKLIYALIAFVVLLSLSNLGTSVAAAFLAKDVTADDGSETGGVATMHIKETGEIAAAQSTGDIYEVDEMSEEDYEERRRLVIEEMEEDPHSHAHRRLARGDDCGDIMEGCNRGVTFDTGTFRGADFEDILRKCQKQQNVNLKRKWGDDVRNDSICSRGTSVVVKEKRGNKNKKNNKKNNKNVRGNVNVKNKRTRDIEVIIEQTDGRTLHVDCEEKRNKCHFGGDVVLGDRGDRCSMRLNECKRGLACRKVGNGRRNKDAKGTCEVITTTMVDIVKVRNGNPGDTCSAGSFDACRNGYYCKPNNFDRNQRNGGGGGDSQGAMVAGPSGIVNTYQNGNGGNNGGNARSAYTGVGTCTRNVGFGQTCYSDFDCGRGNTCDGLGVGDSTTGGRIVGSSGVIVWGDGGLGATKGNCRSN
mmetsp:Transcript_20792/g.43402  ORF Transcript_20792/g.43402 Transcript_20792/m.43402 type:complete len:509 (+) Transcript_20792:117-1643(+)